MKKRGEDMKKQCRPRWLLMIIAVVCLLNACATSSPLDAGISTASRSETISNEDPMYPSEGAIGSGPSDNSRLCVRFIDVGQADCALLECDGHYMLIDGGNRADSSRVYAVLKSLDVTKLDIVVGTHAHEDHIGGIPGAFQYATADMTLSPVTDYSTATFDNFAQSAEAKGGGLTVPRTGDRYTLGGATVTVLGVNSGEDTNDTSIVLKVVLGEVSFLFTGDAERTAEQVMLDAGADLSATVLKVGHHGSDSSTSYPFLRSIMPLYGVISVGTDNEYGHPTREVLDRLEAAEVDVLRTDELGDIVFYTDGRTIRYVSGKNAASVQAGRQDDFGSSPHNGHTEQREQRPDESEDVSTETPVLAPSPEPDGPVDSMPLGASETKVPNEPAVTPLPEPVLQPAPEPPLEPDHGQQQTNTVWIPNSGKKYHSRAGCSGMKNPSEVTLERAISLGFGPCARCY